MDREFDRLFDTLRASPFRAMGVDPNAIAYETQAPGMYPQGFVDTLDQTTSDYVLYNLYNGAFADGPPQGEGVAINATSNKMPGWNGPTSESGSAIAWTWVADSSSPSGHNLRATIVSGAAGDSSYFEQIVVLGGSRKQWICLNPRLVVNVVAISGGTFRFQVRYQFLAKDNALVGGETSLSTEVTTTGLKVTPTPGMVSFPGVASPPATANKVRYRIVVQRHTAADSDTATVDFVDVRSDPGRAMLLLSDVSDPSTHAPGTLYQRDGVMRLQPKGTNGAYADIDGTSGATNGLTVTPLSGSDIKLAFSDNDDGLWISGGHLRTAEIAAPATPASGQYAIYAKTDGNLYGKNDSGVEVGFSSSVNSRAFAFFIS